MNETRFPNDPLEVESEELEPGDDLVICCDGARVAEVYGYGNFPCFDENDEELVAQFNARQRGYADLFAAAPDLYKTLDLILRLYKTATHRHSEDQVRIAMIEEAEAALSRARGEQNEGGANQ